MTILLWSTGALLLGFLLDLLFEDPAGFLHIVRRMGSLIEGLNRRQSHSSTGGVLLVLFVVILCEEIPFTAPLFSYRYLLPLGFPLESLLPWQLLAAKSLKTGSMKVYQSLIKGDTESARKKLSMIVGRDAAGLDADGISRAAVETVAENTSDGVVAPLFHILMGEAALGCFHKTVNTMDSMVGCKNEHFCKQGFSYAAAGVSKAWMKVATVSDRKHAPKTCAYIRQLKR